MRSKLGNWILRSTKKAKREMYAKPKIDLMNENDNGDLFFSRCFEYKYSIDLASMNMQMNINQTINRIIL
ncbi:MAG: hypothetical protein U9O94_02170 [Nanoarchaeota archaeon]|nr:hypothetical protein [Nanoarchaeota archaeon]